MFARVGPGPRLRTRPQLPLSTRINPNKRSFLDLPGEIRNDIYQLAYSHLPQYPTFQWSPIPFQIAGSHTQPQLRGEVSWLDKIPGLWGVSWQVRLEAKPFCPRSNSYICNSPHPAFADIMPLPCVLPTNNIPLFGPIDRLEISLDGWCCPCQGDFSVNEWTTDRRSIDKYGYQTKCYLQEKYAARCYKAARRWTDPEDPFIVLVCLIDKTMPHLRHLVLKLCTAAMAYLDPSMELDGESVDEVDWVDGGEMREDDGQWKNTLPIQSLTRIKDLHSLTITPGGRHMRYDSDIKCPSFKKVKDYLEQRMLRTLSGSVTEAATATEPSREHVVDAWPEQQGSEYDDNWLHDPADDCIDLFEDRVSHQDDPVTISEDRDIQRDLKAFGALGLFDTVDEPKGDWDFHGGDAGADW